MERVMSLASQRAVVIFSKSSCDMCYTIKTFFKELGVNTEVYEIDEVPRGREIERVLARLGLRPIVPAVFIGGQLVGGTNEVMALHLSGSLIPMLRQAGAIWL
ncbi:hypothetical protein GIB67_003573 [Kingdonia uniflora]|uniref:Glutaredoxin domain-containing protein n=1 Tax=Kingdonia uniflora TaxID=39325 RepID=A0A7J7MEQ2_9MAGN|nr:hypothetical protein GIB67_003573 [Kingdonia uniflora]